MHTSRSLRGKTRRKKLVPNTIRETLIMTGNIYVSMLIDRLMSLGYPAGERLTLELCCTALPHIAAKHLRKALQHELFKPSYEPTKGRKRLAGTMPALEDLLRYFYVPDYVSLYGDWLPSWAYSGAKEYRAALHLALIARRNHYSTGRAVSMSRQFQSARLKVCKRTIRNYESWLPIVVKPCYQTNFLRQNDLQNLPKKRTEYHHQWLQVNFQKYPFTRGMAGYLLQKFGEGMVLIYTQLTNEYGLNQGWREWYSRAAA